jgi:hypothetical protein
MGVMKLELVDLVERLWRARWLGWAIVLAYAALVGKGWRDGLRDIGDIDAQVLAQLNFVHTTARDIEAVGRGTLFTVRHDGLRAVLIGPCELRISCRDAEQAMLSLEVGWENARLGDSFRLEDTATHAVHVLDNLVVNHSGLMIPLPKATTTLRFTPSTPALGLRIHGLKLLTGAPLTPFAVDVQWESVHQDATAGVALGTGFWPRTPGRSLLETRRFAYLRVDPARPGPHVLVLAFRRPDPEVPMPIISLGERRIWSVDGCMVWNRATTVDGTTRLELQVDLAATNVIGVECAGRFRSAAELGMNDDLRRVGYMIELDQCEVRAAK